VLTKTKKYCKLQSTNILQIAHLHRKTNLQKWSLQKLQPKPALQKICMQEHQQKQLQVAAICNLQTTFALAKTFQKIAQNANCKKGTTKFARSQTKFLAIAKTIAKKKIICKSFAKA